MLALESQGGCIMGVLRWVALLSLAASGTVFGADDRDPAESDFGQGVDLGAFRLFPTLGLSAGFDSNTALTNGEEIDSWFTRVSPSARLERGSDDNRFSVSATADFATYSDSSRDNYGDYGVRADWVFSPAIKHALALDAGLNWAHDQRGTGAREGDLALIERDVDEYRVSNIDARYRYGSSGARGSLEFDVGARDREYLNNRIYTFARDLTETRIGGEFGWRIASKTSAVIRAEQGNIDYDQASLDSTERRYLAGVRFEPTAKLSGTLLAGRLTKDFDDSSREDFSGSSWRVGVQFKPRTYSTIELSSARETDETNGSGDFILRRDLALSWTHAWNARLSTGLDGGVSNEQHEPSFREDKGSFLGVSANYLLRPWLRGGASYRTFSRSSDVNEFDYNRNLLMISLEASL